MILVGLLYRNIPQDFAANLPSGWGTQIRVAASNPSALTERPSCCEWSR